MLSSSTSRINVRPAQAADLAHVHRLIVELAAYERAEQEVTLALDTFIEDFQAGCFEVTVAVHDDHVVGMALHHARYSTWKGVTWYLEDLVVTESWRGKGVGKALFNEVVAVAQRRDAHRLEWQGLDWNAPAIGFYESLGASVSSEWLNGRLTRAQLDGWTVNSQTLDDA